MAPRPTLDRPAFLAAITRSGLLTTEQVEPILARLPRENCSRTIARYLVEANLLTRFQAELLLAGKTEGFVLGQYRILDQLGRGGMGRVFKAQHVTMNRIVALKVLASSLLRTEKARRLFEREARAAARLHHPNIATAFDANQSGERFYLVMEFVDGPNLQDLVEAHGPLTVAQACECIRQAALGLQHAHELGMVHRDIKPANLLVQRTPSGPVVKILDFGLARLADPQQTGQSLTAPSHGSDSILTTGGAVMGTPDYMPPEQVSDMHAVDIRSDLYSLGCTFYFLLTGRVPFEGGSALDKMVRHKTQAPPALETVRPDVPPPVTAVVRALMEKRPEDRFQSPADLAEILAPLAAGAVAWAPVTPVVPETPRDFGAEESPFARLDDENALLATLGNDQSNTHLGTERATLIRSRVDLFLPSAPRPRTWLWVVLTVLTTLLLGVMIGHYLARS